MSFLVRDWWTTGKSYISWTVDSVRTAYSEYSGSVPISEFSGNLVVLREYTSSSSGGGGGGASLPESSIWAVPTNDSTDLVIEYGIEGHTGAWGLAVAAESEGVRPLNDQGMLIEDNGELFIGMLEDVKSGILTLSMLEVYPSTRSMPDPFWELSGDDLYLTGASQ